MSENFISILIPTYNRPNYLEMSLKSVLQQTYKNFEVVISDNSPNDDTENLIRRLIKSKSDPRIKYVHHRKFNADDNWNFLRTYETKAEWIHWLMDDDALYPNHLEVMLKSYEQFPNASLITSGSNHVDSNGNHLRFEKYFGDKLIRIPGEEAGKLVLTGRDNFIGMPSNILIRKKFLRSGDNAGMSDADRGFFPLIDLSTWFQLLPQGEFVYLPEILTVQRDHQNKASKKLFVDFAICYYIFIRRVWLQKIFLKTEEDLRKSLTVFFPRMRDRGFRLSPNTSREKMTLLRNINSAVNNFLKNGVELPKFEL